MKGKKYLVYFSLVAATLLSSCSNSDDIATYSPTFELKAPSSIGTTSFTWKSGNLSMTEINTGNTTVVALPMAQIPTVTAGEYTITIEGEIEYNTDSFDDNGNPTSITTLSPVRGSKEGVTINNNGISLDIDLIVYNNNSSFVFSEIYVTGSLNVKGTSGIIGDKFFKIYNNSNKTQYADGIALLESVITTVDNFTYTPDFRNEGFASQVVYVIPGDGDNHPVEPGKYLLIADQASNHNATNGNALDMSESDFEWYDYTNKGTDTDNPQVENLDRWYSYSATIWTPSNQGNRSFAIAKIPVKKEDFLAEGSKYYHSDWEYVNSGVTKYKNGYLIPNSWVLDAVNLSPSTMFTKLATSVALDKSFVSISDTGSDVTRFGKSIIRKSAGQMKDEKGNTFTLLTDTDNSKNDFTIGNVSLKK